MQAARGTALTGNRVASEPQPPDTIASVNSPSRRRGRVAALLAVAVTVLVADIVTKVVVVATLSDRAPVRLLGGFLTLRVTRNPGAAFSIGPSLTIVFAVIAVGVIVFILRTSRRIHSLAWAVTLGLLLGGATGNLTDRLLRYPGPFRGYVVDWIQIPHWPVFNIADSCIVCGGVLAVFLAVRGIRIDASVADRHAGQRQAPGHESRAGEAGSEHGDQASPEAPRSQDQQGGGGA
jgi:lipoprotein signal peptidase